MAARAHHRRKEKHSPAHRRAECAVNPPVICRSRAAVGNVARGQPPSRTIPHNQCWRRRLADCRAVQRLYRLGPHRRDRSDNGTPPKSRACNPRISPFLPQRQGGTAYPRLCRCCGTPNESWKQVRSQHRHSHRRAQPSIAPR